MSPYCETNADHTAKVTAIPQSISILVGIWIVATLAGIMSFPAADFQNRNFAYYLCMTGNRMSYASPVLLILLIVLLWRGYRKGLPIPKVLWLQLAGLIYLIFSLGIALRP